MDKQEQVREFGRKLDPIYEQVKALQEVLKSQLSEYPGSKTVLEAFTRFDQALTTFHSDIVISKIITKEKI